MKLRAVVVTMMTAFSVEAFATTMSADQILEKVRNRPDGKDNFAKASLILKEKDGSARTRNLYFLQKDYGKDDHLTLSFYEPADVKGVVLQSINYDEMKDVEDDQWMYLPAMRQIRRISASDKRGSFMGSQFSYIDLDRLRVTDYQQKLLGSEQVGDWGCYLIERIPASLEVKNRTGYEKVHVWVDKETFVVVKQAFFDAKGVPFKEFIAKDLKKIDGVWTVTHSVMQDLVTQRASDLVFSDVHYDVGLDDSYFKKNIMRRGIKDGNLPKVR